MKAAGGSDNARICCVGSGRLRHGILQSAGGVGKRNIVGRNVRVGRGRRDIGFGVVRGRKRKETGRALPVLRGPAEVFQGQVRVWVRQVNRRAGVRVVRVVRWKGVRLFGCERSVYEEATLSHQGLNRSHNHPDGGALCKCPPVLLLLPRTRLPRLPPQQPTQQRAHARLLRLLHCTEPGLSKVDVVPCPDMVLTPETGLMLSLHKPLNNILQAIVIPLLPHQEQSGLFPLFRTTMRRHTLILLTRLRPSHRRRSSIITTTTRIRTRPRRMRHISM